MLLLPLELAQSGGSEVSGMRLWISRDAGASWVPLGNVEGFFADTLLGNVGKSLAAPTASDPVYALSETHVPDELFRLRVAEIANGRWALLPPLPIPGTQPDRLGIVEALTATASGRLLVLGLGPGESLADSGAAAGAYEHEPLWLWEWDPLAARWSVVIPALPLLPSACGDHCWLSALSTELGPDGTGTYLWLSPVGSLSTGTLLRIRLPGQ
jgi:hypothetical protein